MTRWVMAILMFGAGGAFLFMSWGPLHNLFEDYQDSPASTYLLFGLPMIAIAIVFFALGFLSLLFRYRR